MLRLSALLLVVFAAACASPQRLSASIYDHEQLAHVLDERGDHASAAAQRAEAQRERERLVRTEGTLFARGSY